MPVQTSSKNLCGSIFVIIWAREGSSKLGDQEKEYVTIKHTWEQTKNNQGGSKLKDQDYVDVRMYGLPGSLMDPISALKLMLSKLHPYLIVKPCFWLR